MTSLGSFVFFIASSGPGLSSSSIFVSESSNSSLKMYGIFFFARLFVMLCTYNVKSIVFQFLVCDSKTQQTLNYDKYSKKNKKIENTGCGETFLPLHISSIDVFFVWKKWFLVKYKKFFGWTRWVIFLSNI